ncbi:hypothetical protein V2J09_000638 [Rumex salicifolius]
MSCSDKMSTKIRVECLSASHLLPNQKSAMDNLYKLLHTQSKLLSSWNPNEDPCESWIGVTCSDDNSTISKLSLSNLQLTNSTFLPFVCQIDTLESLDVSKNLLPSIPNDFFASCGQIKGLELLNFSLNNISGSFPAFNRFTALESLDLSYNTFSGEIGETLNGLIRLKNLTLNKNQLSGSVPDYFADYKNLTQIDLSFNGFTGKLSSRLGELSNLQTLVISSNNFTGPIPQNLANISTLQRFAANQNQFSGSIPSGFPKSLQKLDLSYNNLNGTIPAYLLTNNNLETLDLSSNCLEGSLPEILSVNSLTRLRLGSNFITGKIPVSICENLVELVYLELENNKLSGIIPSELGSCKKLQLLSLARNYISGELPVELSNLTKLTVLNLQMNKLHGEIPSEISKLSNLVTLNISSNHLNGTIPYSISSLQKLVILDLHGNNVSGSIPSGIGQLNLLGVIQLGMNQLSGDIPLMSSNVYYLNLSNNLFNEKIPNSLNTLSNIQILDLSNNYFFGEVPTFLTRMSSLIQLLLANNKLTGALPSFTRSVDVIIRPGNPDLINTPTASPNTESHPHKRTSVAVTIAIVLSAAITGAIVAVLVVALLRRFYRMREAKIETGEEGTSRFLEGSLLTTNGIHKSSIDFSRAMEAVAGGVNMVMTTRYVTYYKAVMPSGSRYFIKKLNWSGKVFHLSSHESFKREVEALGKLNNSNVMVPLAYMLTDESAFLLYEYAHKGTLFDILHGSSGFALDWASRYSIAIGVAQGMGFLHGCSGGPVLLFDLSSKSIMLKSVKEPQIGDIELCKVIDPLKSSGSLSAVAGSVGYIPPEYAYTMRITAAGNVYSFGVILLELITGKPAVNDGIELAKWVISKTIEHQKWDYILDPDVSQTSTAVQSQMLAVLQIALACVDSQSENRPKMKSITRMLLNAR